MEELKKNRTVKRSQVTRKINELMQFVAENRKDEVFERYDLIKSVFQEFADSHNAYHVMLTDEADIVASDKYFEDVQSNYTRGLTTVRQYIVSFNKSDSTDVTSTKTASFVKLPPTPQPDVFSGNAQHYPMWKASFNTLVGKHDIGYDEKLFYLKQYTAGDARSAIEALFLCPSKHSYEAALDILDTRFGSSTLVTSAFRKTLESWPKIAERDGKGLQKFADYLLQVDIARQTYSSLHILDDEFENKKLVSKLPTSLIEQWVEQVVKSVHFPEFKVFVAFVSEKAKIANHSLWGTVSSKPKPNANPLPHTQNKSHNHAIETSIRTACPLCKSNHTLSKCTAFSNMTLPERRQVIRDNNLCFGCLNTGHQSKACRSRHTCAVCTKKHPTLLHDYNQSVTQQPTSLLLDIHTQNRATTMVVPVLLSHKSSDEEILVYALLDTQSNTNFITDDTLSKLNVTGQDTTLEVTTLNGKTKHKTKVVSNLQVRGVDSDTYVDLSRVFSRDSIPCSRSSIPTNDIVEQWPHLSRVDLPPYFENAPVGLLIGFTCPQAIRPLDVVAGSGKEPFGWKTSLGWCVVGLCSSPSSADSIGCSHTVHGNIAYRADCREIVVDVLDDPFDEHADLFSEVKYSVDDIRFLEIMHSDMKQRSDKHYEAPLPLKYEPNLPNNRNVALKRLFHLKKKFARDEAYHKKYASFVDDMLVHGFAEVVPAQESGGPPGKTWYIPHHGVPKEEKIRVVFDCSAQFQGTSLNDLLLQGPDLLNKLIGILFRFRLNQIAFTCDIEKMYHQFKVEPSFRDLLRFLWWPNGDVNLEPIDHRMTVHLFGATSSPGVATFALRQIAHDYAHLHPPQSSDFVNTDFYVDDGVKSVSSVAEGIALFGGTQSLLAEGGLRLHKVKSNSPEFMAAIPPEDRAPSKGQVQKTLGVAWDTSTDQLCIPLEVYPKQISRRNILSVVSSIFDPFGMVAPLILQAKLMLQQLCREDFSWDDPLPPDISLKFEQWCHEMNALGIVQVPRRATPDSSVVRYELHHFADASTEAYAACSYLRSTDADDNHHVAFMFGKCKVVPLKPVHTVPRLELMAAVLAVQQATLLRKELHLPIEEYFWTDSTTVLSYIQNTSVRFKVFVANRVQKIHAGSKPEQWHHVASAENPADQGSRAMFTEKWLDGPDFLHRNDFLPDVQSALELNPDDMDVRCLDSVVDEPVPAFVVSTSWYRTKRIWAWVHRFINNCRSQKRSGELDLTELVTAETALLAMAQRDCFASDLQALRSHGQVSRNSQLSQLDVFLDQGLIRVGGRLRHGSLAYDLKHPIVMPENHVITDLIVEHFHNATQHQGRGLTVAEIRSHGFWIVGLTKKVKKLIRSCVRCQRLRGKPCKQKMADLPVDRLTPSAPFQFCGCDLFGPFVVKSARKELKRYAVLFTCLNSRAVHLEVVHSLTTDSFLNAFRRFVAIRGPVQQLRCDRGTNFVGAQTELLNMGCDLVLNPPASSHRGGVWERMIGTTRRVLEGLLLQFSTQLTEEGLTTLLAEAGSIVNSRPLNVDTLNDPLSLEPLTANHLLTMKSKVITRPPVFREHENAGLYALQQWKRVQYLADLFWSRWKKEILYQNQRRTKWSKASPNLKVDDLVLIVDDNLHRSHWKLGRVVDVKVSRDGLVRCATVILPDRSKLERPAQKLVPILTPNVV